MAEMKYIVDDSIPKEPLILEQEDWTYEEWSTILKIFGMEVAERIKISDYKFEAWGIAKVVISPEDWKKAKEHLDLYISEYAMLGPTGRFGLMGVLWPLKERYDKGERSLDLYNSMMEVE